MSACTCTEDPGRLTYATVACPIHRTPQEVAAGRALRAMALDSPMCSACERPVGSGSFVRRGALVYCGQCNAKARADAYSRRESRSDSLLEVARQYAHGSASEDDVLGSAKDYAAACREEEALR